MLAVFGSSQHQSNGNSRICRSHPSFLPERGKFNSFWLPCTPVTHSALCSAGTCPVSTTGSFWCVIAAPEPELPLFAWESHQVILDPGAIPMVSGSPNSICDAHDGFRGFLAPKSWKVSFNERFFPFFPPHYFFLPSLSSPLFYLTACTCFIAQLAQPLPIKNISCPVVDIWAFVWASWSIN